MQKTLIASLLSVMAAAPALAGDGPHSFSGNVTLASEYLYRGIAQTNGKPALQGGFDYAHSSGFYAGVWGSNISWLQDGNNLGCAAGACVSSSVELDVYGGYKGAISDDLGFDLGVLTYNYPGSNLATGAGDPDTTEVYGAVSWKWLTAKYSRTTTSLFGWTQTANAAAKTKGSGYLELNAAYDLGDGWGVSGHVGKQSVKGRSSAAYTDWKLGVTKALGMATVGLAYSDTNAKGSCALGEDYCNAYGRDLGKGRLLLTLGASF
jgi:uncharacterized protein (TIGR02001 family)